MNEENNQAQATSAPAVPEGWIPMPMELTPEMKAVLKEIAPRWNAESIYSSLIDAAPAAPATTPYPTRADCEAEALTPAVAAQPQPVAEQGDLAKCIRSLAMVVAEEGIKAGSGYMQSVASDRVRAVADGVLSGDTGKGILQDIHRAAIAASQPHDADAAKRLRLICKLVGIESHVPADDETLWGAAFAVLGKIRAALEARQQAAEPVAWLSAVASCVSSGHATTEAAKHLLMVIESDGLPKFPAIQQPQPAVEREIPVGEKGWRPACCDHAKGAACCDIGYCIADKERAELAQQPQDERAAFEEALSEIGRIGHAGHGWHGIAWAAWQARATLAKKGGAA